MTAGNVAHVPARRVRPAPLVRLAASVRVEEEVADSHVVVKECPMARVPRTPIGSHAKLSATVLPAVRDAVRRADLK